MGLAFPYTDKTDFRSSSELILWIKSKIFPITMLEFILYINFASYLAGKSFVFKLSHQYS